MDLDVPRDWVRLRFEAMQAFSPGAPIDEQALFAGRRPEIRMMLDAVMLRGMHAVVFGERGVGKTSLANTFWKQLTTATTELRTVRVDCHPKDDYNSLWRKIFDHIPVESDGQANEQTVPLSTYYDGEIVPDHVIKKLSNVSLNSIHIIIIDEFDRLTNQKSVTTPVADTIKALSNESASRQISMTIIIVGVAKSVTDLIRRHESIVRNIIQIPLDRMSTHELKDIVLKRLERLEMQITDYAIDQIALLSKGLPHYTHLLGMYSAVSAIDEQKNEIEEHHVDSAIEICLARIDQTTKENYHRAMMSPRRDNLYSQAILACALAETDQLGFFTPAAVREPMSQIMKARFDIPRYVKHLKEFCEPKRGPILETTGEARGRRYRFIDPMMQPYVIMQGLADGWITKDDARRVLSR